MQPLYRHPRHLLTALNISADENIEGELLRDGRGETRVLGRRERQPLGSHAHHPRHDGATRDPS